MSKLTMKDVEIVVIDTVAGFSQINAQQIKLEWELKKPPLSFDDYRLAFLTLSLRGYIKYYSNNTETLLAKEVQKSGVKVESLIKIVYERVEK